MIAARASAAACPICRAGRPTHVVAELASGWVTAGEAAPLRGTCAVFARRHVVELHELTREEAAAYVHDLQRVARAVQRLTGAPKLNYEVHGNTIPHLHTHIFPRRPGDPFQGGPIDPRRDVGPVYAPGEFAAYAAALRAAVEGPGE